MQQAKLAYFELSPWGDTTERQATYESKHKLFIEALEDAEYALAHGTHTDRGSLPVLFIKQVDMLATELPRSLDAYRAAFSQLVVPGVRRQARRMISTRMFRSVPKRFVQHDDPGGLVDQVVGATFH